MGKSGSILFLSVVIFIVCVLCALVAHGQLLPIVDEHGDNASRLQTYIVHVLKPEGVEFLGAEDLEKWHESLLPNASLDSGEPRLVYSYREAISGFAARLTAEEVHEMERMDGFLHAQPDKLFQLQTTYTHEFLNLSTPFGVWDTSNSFYGEGIIVGVIDSGIYRTHPSFSDAGMPPTPPSRVWKAKCYFQHPACDNKIIGAQTFIGGPQTTPPNDTDGHGTHVAGIAAGNFVDDAEVLGQAKGRAAGTAPKAYISVYKVCSQNECWQSDTAAAVDQAIQDGVHILQMSIGPPIAGIYSDLRQDLIAVATFNAVHKGIFPCTVAGNEGPELRTLGHEAPWDMVVGASTTDRRIQVTVTLGDANMTELHGESAFQSSAFTTNFLPLVYPGINGQPDASLCFPYSLNKIDVRHKIVLCEAGNYDTVSTGIFVEDAGGSAMIIMNGKNYRHTTISDHHHTPAARVSYMDGRTIQDYVFSNPNPTAKLTFRGTVFGARPTPALASFSSRGPTTYNGGILKPDLTAPGVNILSAWPFEVGPNPTGLKKKTFAFNHGTSMATPHVSGIVALIMSKLKNDGKRLWSPSEIQSALITTTDVLDLDGNRIFDQGTFNESSDHIRGGAGQVNASAVMDPGLVYSINPSDYVAYLCGLYSNDSKAVSVFTKNNTRCTRSISGLQLNYPAFGVTLGPNSTTVSVTRTVTNVGDANEVYWAEVQEPLLVKVDLSDYSLSFSRVDQQLTYEIRFTLNGAYPGPGFTAEGWIWWESDKHNVRSSIIVSF